MQLDVIQKDILMVVNALNGEITNSQVHALLLKIHELSAVIGNMPLDPALEPVKEEVAQLKERISKRYSELLTIPKVKKHFEIEVETAKFSKAEKPLNEPQDKFQTLRSRLGNISRSPRLIQAAIPVRQAYVLLISQVSFQLSQLTAPEDWVEQLENFDLKNEKALEQLRDVKIVFEKEIQDT